MRRIFSCGTPRAEHIAPQYSQSKVANRDVICSRSPHSLESHQVYRARCGAWRLRSEKQAENAHGAPGRQCESPKRAKPRVPVSTKSFFCACGPSKQPLKLYGANRTCNEARKKVCGAAGPTEGPHEIVAQRTPNVPFSLRRNAPQTNASKYVCVAKCETKRASEYQKEISEPAGDKSASRFQVKIAVKRVCRDAAVLSKPHASHSLKRERVRRRGRGCETKPTRMLSDRFRRFCAQARGFP